MALQDLERAALEDRASEMLLKDMISPSMPLCREVLIHLEEAGWVVASHVRARLERVFTGAMHTKAVEECFNTLSDRQGKASSKTLSRIGRWCGALTAGTEEKYGFRALRSTAAAAAAAAPKLPPDIFTCDGSECSLGRDVLESLSSDSWCSPSPGAYALVPLMTSVLLVHSKGECKLHQCWKSLLVEESCVVWKKSNPHMRGLVLKTTPYGCLLCLVLPKRASDKQVIFFEVLCGEASFELRHIAIDDWDEWCALPVDGCSLVGMARRMPPDEWVAGVVLRSTEPASSLLRIGAKRGFKNMTLPHLKKVYRALELPSPVLGTVHVVLASLVRHIFPELSAVRGQKSTQTQRNCPGSRRRGTKAKGEESQGRCVHSVVCGRSWGVGGDIEERASARNKSNTMGEPSCRPGCLILSEAATHTQLLQPFSGGAVAIESRPFRLLSTCISQI